MSSVCCVNKGIGKLYAATDVSISLKFFKDVTINIDNVVDINILLKKTYTGEEIPYSMSSGDIRFYTGVEGDEPKHFILNINKEDILLKGKYKMSVRVVDIEGEVRGLTPSPDYLIFN